MVMPEKFESFKVYPIDRIGEFEQFVLSCKINAKGYFEYEGLALYQNNSAFCIGGIRRIAKENATSPLDDRNSVVKPLSDWIFQMYLFQNNIECSKVGSFYQLLPIEQKPAIGSIPAQIGLPYLEDLVVKLDGFPVEFRSLTKEIRMDGDMLLLRNTNSPNSYYLKFEWKGGKRYALGDSVLKTLNSIEERLSSIWFERYKKYDPKGPYEDYESRHMNWFQNKLTSAFRNKDFKWDYAIAGLMWHDLALLHELKSYYTKRFYNYTFNFNRLSYALTVGTRVFYLDDLELFIDAISFSVEAEIDSWESSRNDSGSSADELMGDAFEGDRSNLWNID